MIHPQKPIALIVLLENVGHVAGLRLPRFVMSAIDYVTEEYAKMLLRYYGARHLYDRVVVLEDELATGPHLADAILSLSRTHRVDLLLLVHGKEGYLVGYRGKELIGKETFDVLRAARRADPAAVDIRAVFGLNCYGVSLAVTWMELGASVANGTAGVNWLPEPSLSVFLRNWLGGRPYSVALQRSHTKALRWGRRLLRTPSGVSEHPMIASSRQVVYGQKDLTIAGRG